ncbi:MAG TPA: helix-turn-helix transcriptional regulator [Thermomicrobiales bacterium]|nr:helix-turn-helix transcriptional regulator [Thermomicrobiales bacterium]
MNERSDRDEAMPPRRDPPRGTAEATLTEREVEVLRLVADGCTDREIAGTLFVSHHTVANHVKNVLGKFDVRSRAAAVALAARHGML